MKKFRSFVMLRILSALSVLWNGTMNAWTKLADFCDNLAPRHERRSGQIPHPVE